MARSRTKKEKAVGKDGIYIPRGEDDDGLDEQCRMLLRSGLVRARYTFTGETSLQVPTDMVLLAPWNLPSRMFRFPIEMTRPEGDHPRRFGLMHLLLGDHPFVRRVESVLGITLDPAGAPNQHGYSKSRLALWWHAADLIRDGLWERLLDTREFSNTDNIVRAVEFGLHYHNKDKTEGKRRNLTTQDARRILQILGVAEPSPRPLLKDVFSAPSAIAEDKKTTRWAINHSFRATSEQLTWGTIHALETGTFKHDKGGYLQWSERGRTRYGAPAKPAGAESEAIYDVEAGQPDSIPTVIEKNGQAGFDF